MEVAVDGELMTRVAHRRGDLGKTSYLRRQEEERRRHIEPRQSLQHRGGPLRMRPVVEGQRDVPAVAAARQSRETDRAEQP
ncbi:hypothetical protein GCM10023403_48410 [Pseudonocardia benzenivorans]|nr:hypothetical protein PSD17_14210 [Pseudonocardia sp. D17]